MAFSVSSLSTYTAPARELLAKAVAAPSTVPFINVYTGIKGSEYVNTNYSTMVFGSQNCGTSYDSTTTVTQALLSVEQFSYDEKLCPADFNTKSMNNKLKAGSANDDITFINMFMDEKAQTIAFEMEKVIWGGNKTTGSGNMAKMNGFLQILLHTSASANTVSGTTSVSTAADAVTLVNKVVRRIPAAVINRPDLVVFLPTDIYRLYVEGLNLATAANLQSTNTTAQNMVMKHPYYSNVTIVGTIGLDSGSVLSGDYCDAVATYGENFLFGTDIESEGSNSRSADMFDIWFSKDLQSVVTAARWKAGVQVAFPEFVVIER